ncbi:hypothetical protein DFH08DRAFT_886584 [Mycena albidolilacea]|uniref:Uncharacterized protein n=1 Tax=Mycena albidolilacea TaxID=1033008 RepID=A0AAD6ZIX2_9AGAR|nr:hypothetical protein DFH08DRAFT_886584 [Mycena albidolilacea]
MRAHRRCPNCAQMLLDSRTECRRPAPNRLARRRRLSSPLARWGAPFRHCASPARKCLCTANLTPRVLLYACSCSCMGSTPLFSVPSLSRSRTPRPSIARMLPRLRHQQSPLARVQLFGPSSPSVAPSPRLHPRVSSEHREALRCRCACGAGHLPAWLELTGGYCRAGAASSLIPSPLPRARTTTRATARLGVERQSWQGWGAFSTPHCSHAVISSLCGEASHTHPARRHHSAWHPCSRPCGIHAHDCLKPRHGIAFLAAPAPGAPMAHTAVIFSQPPFAVGTTRCPESGLECRAGRERRAHCVLHEVARRKLLRPIAKYY